MKKKVKIILPALAAALVIAVIGAGLIIKSQKNKNNYKDLVKDFSAFDYNENNSRDIYEYLLTGENGLVTTYTFRICEENGKYSGRIDVDGTEAKISVICAVAEEEDSTVFVFAEYAKDSEPYGKFTPGDVMAKLHRKDGKTIPELLTLPRIGDGDLLRNY